jgi:hypothetical protein
MMSVMVWKRKFLPLYTSTLLLDSVSQNTTILAHLFCNIFFLIEIYMSGTCIKEIIFIFRQTNNQSHVSKNSSLIKCFFIKETVYNNHLEFMTFYDVLPSVVTGLSSIPIFAFRRL